VSDIDRSLKLAEALADDRLSDEDLEDDATGPFAALRRISQAFRSVASKDATLDDKFEFEWHHLQVREKIGQGGFGDVYRAFDPILRRDVALKLSRRSHSAAEAAIIAEARLMARLRHPNILAIHGADTDSERAGIWCDLLTGQTLDHVLKQHPHWGVDEVLAIATPLASAIEAIHENGLTHGDIKPANVMITSAGVPVLMDFGAGRELSKAWSSGAGSPLLMAPEQFETLETSRASDVYAFGALLYRVLSGRYPVEAADFESLEVLHKAGAEPDWSLVHKAFRPLLKRMLRRAPGARPDAVEINRDIAALASAPQRRRRRFAVAVVIASLAAGLVLASYGMKRAQDAEAEALQQKAAAEASLDFLQQMLMSPTGINQGANVRMIDALDLAHTRLQASPPESAYVRANVEQTLGLTYQNLDQYEKARPLLESALNLYRAGATECCGDEAEMQTALAENSLSRGDVELALEQLQAAELAVASSGTDLPLLRVEILAVRADAMSALGNEAESAALQQQALDAVAGMTGDHSELRADLLSDLASSLIRISDLETAEVVALESLQWFESNLGVDNFKSTKPRHVLSTVKLVRGEFAEAERLARVNLEVMETLAPEASSDRMATLINILDILLQTGRFDEALVLSQDLYDVFRELHGPQHERTLKARANIGVTLSAMERYDEAAEVFRENWDIQRVVIGETALDTLISRGNFAESLLFSGEVVEAEKVASAANDANIEALGADHYATLYFAGVLAQAKSRLGKTREAIALLDANLAAMNRSLGEDNRMSWDTVEYLVEALIADGQKERAVPLAERLVTYRTDNQGDAHPKTELARGLLQKASAL
jgi:tetratricopeptide (TPR) repeat protein